MCSEGRPESCHRTKLVAEVLREHGIDVLVEQKFRPLRNKRVRLVTNHTGRTRGGASTIDVLFRAPDVKLVKLFSPEHGIRGELDIPGGSCSLHPRFWLTSGPIVPLLCQGNTPDF